MRLLSTASVVILAILALACGNPMAKVREAADRTRQQNEMKELGISLHAFNDENNKTPANFAEFEKWSMGGRGYGMSPAAMDAVRSGQTTVIWGFDLMKSTQKVVAYRATNGNQTIVLLGDASVQSVPSADFGAMTMAVPATPEVKTDKLPGVNK